MPGRGRDAVDMVGERGGDFQVGRDMSSRLAKIRLARRTRRRFLRRDAEHLLELVLCDLGRDRRRAGGGRRQPELAQDVLNLRNALRRPPFAAQKNLKLDRWI
jgi:hypothetical protein